MTITGGSYIRQDGKLTRVGGTEEPAAIEAERDGATSPAAAEPRDKTPRTPRKGA